MGKYLGLAIGKDQCQFVRKSFPVMQYLCAILFLFFPMISELDRSPVRNVAIISFAEYPVEHACGAEQSNMPAMKRRERPASDITLSGEKDSARLAIGGRIKQ